MDKSECDRLAEHTTTLDAVANALDSLDSLQEEADEQAQTYWGNEDVCTYDRGYISQPVYACRVCSKGELKGFCYGCSMTCHLDHASEVIELFTKRDFRCDCPTLHHNHCSLHERIVEENGKNAYNHNFEGLYCVCNKPYLESEDMIQCELCQDWFHDDCLKKEDIIFDISDESEFVCLQCVRKYSFILTKYPQLEFKPDPTIEEEKELQQKIINREACLISGIEIGVIKSRFFVPLWRNQLCRCDTCGKKYQYVGFDKLIKEDEEELDFEDVGTAADKQVAIGMDLDNKSKLTMLYNSTDLETQHKFLGRLQDLKEKFGNFLLGYQQKEPDRPVSKRDIDQFFQSITREEPENGETKKRKLNL